MSKFADDKSCCKLMLLGFCFGLLLAGCAKKETEPPAQPTTAAPIYTKSLEPELPESVRRIFQRSCQSCHGFAGHGIAAVAPDLRLAKPRSLEQWRQYLGAAPNGAQSGHPGTQMPPPTWINADEITVVANYMVSLTQPGAIVSEPPVPAER